MKSLETQHGGSHYKGLAIEPAEFCQRNGLKFCEGNAIKYLARHGSKGKSEDVKKAIHYCQMILEMEYGIQSTVDYSEAGTEQERMQKAGVK